MATVILCGIFLLIILAGVLLCICTNPDDPTETGILAPFCILPVAHTSPSVRAFLERYAAQTAWIDSAVLHSVILVYPDDDAEAALLCEEMAEQYDFFSCMSALQMQAFLAMRMDIVKKTS